MNIAILSNIDLTSSLIFKEVCCHEDFEIVGVGFSSTLTKKGGFLAGMVDLFRRCDKKYFIYMCFLNGVYALKEMIFFVIFILEKSLGKDFFSLRNYARRNKIEVVNSNDFNSPEFIQKLKTWNPDIVLTRINQILKNEILNLPKYGCLCCHSSLLPAYKGIAAEFYNLLNGEKNAGFTIFQMTEKLDKGDILSQEEIDISERDSLYSLTVKNAKHGSCLLLKTLIQRKNGPLPLMRQYTSGNYYSWPDSQSAKLFKKKKNKFIRLTEVVSYLVGYS